MARNGVTREQVVQAAEQLAAEGAQVTVAAVRTLLGGTGSYTTISTHLKAWRETQSLGPPPLPKELERSALGFLGRLWRLLLEGIGLEVRRRTEGRVEELATGVRQCEAELRQLHQEQVAERRQVEALQTAMDQSQEALARMEQELTVMHHGQQELEQRERALEQRLDGPPKN